MGYRAVVIDPDENAPAKDLANVFIPVMGNDFNKTLQVAKDYEVKGIVTAATDKPLIMMARVAEALNLSFFTVKTAECSTDKFLMKQKFLEFGIPCAKGFLLNNLEELSNISIKYPVIVKPRDNSGSRGVIYSEDYTTLQSAINEALHFTKTGNVLVEEFIGGKEYSVEGIHYNGESYVIQITEKITTKFPYNVELGHLQPADLSAEIKNKIKQLLCLITKALGFENCASHTELKISSTGIKIIETSPRLGGDFISSTLVPLSTGVNMEDLLIDISMSIPLLSKYFEPKKNTNSAIIFFELPVGKITNILNLDEISHIEGIYSWNFDLNVGDKVNKITSSLNRYGYAIFQSSQKKIIDSIIIKVNNIVHKNIKIQLL